MRSRDEWNDPPSDSSTCASPYQLRSSTVASGASRSSESCRPAPVALVWTTRSRSPREPATSSGRAKPTPSRAATSARVGSTSTSVTRHPGIPASRRATQQPTIPAPTTATRSPTRGAASQSALTAVSTVPASTARLAGTSSGTTTTDSTGTTYAVWCGCRQKTVRPDELRRPLLDDADAEVAVLHRRREVTLLVRGAHDGVLVLGHGAAEDDRLGAAAHARVQGAHEHLARAGRGHGSRPDLAPAGLDHPERPRIGGHATRLDRP